MLWKKPLLTDPLHFKLVRRPDKISIDMNLVPVIFPTDWRHLLCQSTESIHPKSLSLMVTTYQNHRMVWVGRDLIDHLVPTPLPRAGTPSTRPGCPKPHSTWPWGSIIITNAGNAYYTSNLSKVLNTYLSNIDRNINFWTTLTIAKTAATACPNSTTADGSSPPVP